MSLLSVWEQGDSGRGISKAERGVPETSEGGRWCQKLPQDPVLPSSENKDLQAGKGLWRPLWLSELSAAALDLMRRSSPEQVQDEL